jgi:hypothetical protein
MRFRTFPKIVNVRLIAAAFLLVLKAQLNRAQTAIHWNRSEQQHPEIERDALRAEIKQERQRDAPAAATSSNAATSLFSRFTHFAVATVSAASDL